MVHISETPRGGDAGGASGEFVTAAKRNDTRDNEPRKNCKRCGRAFEPDAQAPFNRNPEIHGGPPAAADLELRLEL